MPLPIYDYGEAILRGQQANREEARRQGEFEQSQEINSQNLDFNKIKMDEFQQTREARELAQVAETMHKFEQAGMDPDTMVENMNRIYGPKGHHFKLSPDAYQLFVQMPNGGSYVIDKRTKTATDVRKGIPTDNEREQTEFEEARKTDPNLTWSQFKANADKLKYAGRPDKSRTLDEAWLGTFPEGTQPTRDEIERFKTRGTQLRIDAETSKPKVSGAQAKNKQLSIEARKNSRLQALEREARQTYMDEQTLLDGKQAIQNQFENEMEAAGFDVEHFDYPAFGSPTATPKNPSEPLVPSHRPTARPRISREEAIAELKRRGEF